MTSVSSACQARRDPPDPGVHGLVVAVGDATEAARERKVDAGHGRGAEGGEEVADRVGPFEIGEHDIRPALQLACRQALDRQRRRPQLGQSSDRLVPPAPPLLGLCQLALRDAEDRREHLGCDVGGPHGQPPSSGRRLRGVGQSGNVALQAEQLLGQAVGEHGAATRRDGREGSPPADDRRGSPGGRGHLPQRRRLPRPARDRPGWTTCGVGFEKIENAVDFRWDAGREGGPHHRRDQRCRHVLRGARSSRDHPGQVRHRTAGDELVDQRPVQGVEAEHDEPATPGGAARQVLARRCADGVLRRSWDEFGRL